MFYLKEKAHVLNIDVRYYKTENRKRSCNFMLIETYEYTVHAVCNQNQPALEKDRYKIRQAFIAAPGNSLIVADYGQVSDTLTFRSKVVALVSIC